MRTRVGNRSTTAHYGYSLRNHVYGFEVAAGVAFGDLADVEVSREHVKSLVRHLTDRFAPNTVASIFIAVAAVFTDLRKSGVIERSPCANVPLPEHVESCVFVPVTLQQLDTLASRLHGPWQIAPYLGHAAGLRIGEALAVRLDQLVEGEEGWVLRITRQVLGAQRLAPLKHRRADQFREVPVPEFLYQRIMEHAERWSIPEDGFLCPGRSAPYVHRPSFYEDFRDGWGRGIAGRIHFPLVAARLRVAVYQWGDAASTGVADSGACQHGDYGACLLAHVAGVGVGGPPGVG